MNVFNALTILCVTCAASICVEVAAQPSAEIDAEKSQEQTLSDAISVYSAAMESTDKHGRRQLFERAYLLFQKAAGGDRPNAALLTNQGNAALQANRIGPAIVAYRRAVACDPGYRRAQANLAYARSTLPIWAMRNDTPRLLDSLFFWHRAQPSTVHLCAAGAFLLAALLMAGGIRMGQPILRNLAIIPTLLWLLLIGSTWAAASLGRPPEAVVTVDEVIARSADSVTAAPRLSTPLPSGTELVVIEDRDDWLYARIGNNQSAWLPASSVARVP